MSQATSAVRLTKLGWTTTLGDDMHKYMPAVQSGDTERYGLTGTGSYGAIYRVIMGVKVVFGLALFVYAKGAADCKINIDAPACTSIT
jgi:hypothetical protein